MEKVIYESPGGWIQVLETPNKFYFSRRKGRDSVAIFLVRKIEGRWEVLIRMQPLPLYNGDVGEDMILSPCPITGSLDSGRDMHITALKEAEEEAGYKLDILNPLGSYVVGTQTDEMVFMYWADVTGIKPEEAKQDGTIFEQVSKNVWKPLYFLDKNGAYVANQIGFFRLKNELMKYEYPNLFESL